MQTFICGFVCGIVISILVVCGCRILRSRLSGTSNPDTTVRDCSERARDDNFQLTAIERRETESLKEARGNVESAKELIERTKALLDKYNNRE